MLNFVMDFLVLKTPTRNGRDMKEKRIERGEERRGRGAFTSITSASIGENGRCNCYSTLIA